jgi:hypothetical protein
MVAAGPRCGGSAVGSFNGTVLTVPSARKWVYLR